MKTNKPRILQFFKKLFGSSTIDYTKPFDNVEMSESGKKMKHDFIDSQYISHKEFRKEVTKREKNRYPNLTEEQIYLLKWSKQAFFEKWPDLYTKYASLYHYNNATGIYAKTIVSSYDDTQYRARTY